MNLQRADRYELVLVKINEYKDRSIPVPELAKLLEVNSSTLNARFRRENRTLEVVGRTSFLPYAEAIKLAVLHEYALRGYLTVEEAHDVTGALRPTIRSRCENEVYGKKFDSQSDLTGRLRINPKDVERLIKEEENKGEKPKYEGNGREPNVSNTEKQSQLTQTANSLSAKVFYPPVQKVNYEPRKRKLVVPNKRADENAPPIFYDSNNPPLLTKCPIGRRVISKRMEGTIEGYALGNEQIPQIRVHFPAEIDENLKHVNLVVKGEYV